MTLNVTNFVVAKHGSHNQADHGRGKGGTAGAGSGGEVDAAKEDLNNRAIGAEAQVGRSQGYTEGQRTMHDQRAQGTADGYRTAANYVGKPDKMNALHSQFGGNVSDSMSAYQQGIATAINAAHQTYGALQG